MKGSGNRCRCESQYIYIFFQLLYFLFVGDSKSLFFVYDKQPQILEGNILGQHSMGSDHNIYKAPFLYACPWRS